MFLRALENLIKKRSLANVNFLDGSSEVGFILYADEDTFDMAIRDNVYNPVILEQDNEKILLEKEDDLKEIDFVFTTGTFMTQAIDNIVHDVSHQFTPDQTTWFDLISEGLYETYETDSDEEADQVIESEEEK